MEKTQRTTEPQKTLLILFEFFSKPYVDFYRIMGNPSRKSFVLGYFLKRKIIKINFFIQRFRNRLFSFLVHRIAINVNGLGIGRTGILASAAPDADFGIHFGDKKPVASQNHSDSLCRTVFGASAAIGFVGNHNTVAANEVGNTYLCCFLLLAVQWFDGAGRTNAAANQALVIAKTEAVIQAGLHDSLQAVFGKGRHNDLLWAG
jgi:hypothetical protein